MAGAWTLEIDDRRIAWLTFDQQGARVNTLSPATITELFEQLNSLAAGEDPRALVIRSGKPDSFIVGADIDELAGVEDEATARALADTGQCVFGRIADLPFPTIAAIHGACMGGGLELSLACDHRLASSDPRTRLALPEVNLGILPGWGGTQRLPRLIGLAPALTMILTGKTISGRRAVRMGLTDGSFTPAFAETQISTFVDSLFSPGGTAAVHRRRRRALGRMNRALQAPFLRSIVFRRAEKQVREKTGGHYPAPLEALRVVRETYGGPMDRGLSIEAEALGRLAVSDISRNLVRLFQLDQRAKKIGVGAEPVRTAGVVGAGIMGGGIAWSLANAGIDVRLKDISWDAIGAGMKAASRMFDAQVKRRRLTENGKGLAMNRIGGCVEYTGFGRLDAVVEAVVENLEIKRRVLAEIEAAVPDDCLICTNTSSLPIEDLAGALKRPERFVGLHFFNPVNRMRLVEVVPCQATSEAFLTRAGALTRQIDKLPMVVGGCPGFLVNRILVPYIVEAARMFEEGVDLERIDGALERFGMPMGPLALADEVGLDVGVKVAHVLEDSYGDRMSVPDGFDRIVAGGELHGKKAGRGFYVYDKKSKKPNPDARRAALNGHGDAASAIPDEDIVDRAVLCMVNEAARCLEEGVARKGDDIDIAMVMGTGFAPFRGGLVRYADDRGAAPIVQRLRDLESRFGERFAPAPLLEAAAGNGGRLSAAKLNGEGGS